MPFQATDRENTTDQIRLMAPRVASHLSRPNMSIIRREIQLTHKEELVKTLMTAAALALVAGLAGTTSANAAAAVAASKALDHMTDGAKSIAQEVNYRHYRRHRGPSLYFSFGHRPRYYGYSSYRPRHYGYSSNYYRRW